MYGQYDVFFWRDLSKHAYSSKEKYIEVKSVQLGLLIWINRQGKTYFGHQCQK
jgi:hypothetical protein